MEKHIQHITWLVLAVSCGLIASAEQHDTIIPFRNPDLSLERRVDDLLSRLTIDEKISQSMMSSPAIPRLKIPAYDWWNEGLHGVAMNGIATVFPQAIGLAATWNPALLQQVADVISSEFRAKNNETIRQGSGDTKRGQGLTVWSPNINIVRDPRWGRGQETYGEDPFLSGCLATAFVHGLQGNDPRYLKTVATLKHYAVHSGPEPSRHRFNAVVSNRDLRETYLPAFETGIREGGATSVMSAYNAINGVPAPAHELLLGQILRGEWGFAGAVVGDVDNVADMWRPKAHEFAKDAAEASALAIKGGTDLCSGRTYEGLPEALKKGLVKEADIDKALRRLLTLRFKLGQFDPPERVPFRSIPISENDAPAHSQLALEAARQSLVLLKNDGALPWSPRQLKTVAVLGPAGSEEKALLGNYNGTPSQVITLAKGIKNKLEPMGVEVLVEPGVPLVKGFRMSGKPFPEGFLFADERRSEPGLKGEVFSHKKQDSKKAVVEGERVSTRTDNQIDLHWDEAQPKEGIPIANASARWTGIMVPPKSGEYVLGVVAEGAVRLFVDDKPVINSWGKAFERPLSTSIALEAGKSYPVRLEYAQLTRKGRIQFGVMVPGQDDALERALAAAARADHIVLTLGLTPNLEGESMSVAAEGFDGGDRTSILMPGTQCELLEKVAALKKPTVLVLTTGSAVSFNPDQANAVLLCWYYGQRGAEAVAEVLVGEANPAGRLPITFYRSDKDLPNFKDYSMANRTYRYFTGKPLYAFGHGLSYSTFAYNDMSLSSVKASPGDTIIVKTVVKNTGKMAGDEVVQVYAEASNPPVSMPIRWLVGFQRVSLRPDEVKTIEIPVPVQRLRRWDEKAGRYCVDSGSYELGIGTASDQVVAKAALVVSGR